MRLAPLPLVLASLGPVASWAQDAAPTADEDTVEEIVVETVTSRPGEVVLDADTVRAFPARDGGDYLRALPGMHLAQHGGRGKAWQLFYRGFDAVHGADVAGSVEGIPLNESSQVHAHGYLDLATLPTDLIREVRLSPGAERADVGAFATAASVDLRLGLQRPGAMARLTGGTDRGGSLTVGYRPPTLDDTFVYAKGDVGRGVGEGRRWRLIHAGVGHGQPLGTGTLRAFALGYHGDFDSPGALRLEDVEGGEKGFYDAYPGAGGGTSERVLAGAVLRQAPPSGELSADAWIDGRRFSLDQNFTGFLSDPVHGDGTRQSQESLRLGAGVSGRWTPFVAGRRWGLGGGFRMTGERLRQREEALDVDGRPRRTDLDGTLRQVLLDTWLEGDLGWREHLRLVPAVHVAVAGQRAGSGGEEADPSWTPYALPRLRLEGRPHERLTLFAGYGHGYRPPAVLGGVVGSAVVSRGLQGGADLRWHPVRLTATGFATWLGDELVFDHPSGRFLSVGATRRVGVEGVIEASPRRWLGLTATLTWSDGRVVEDGRPVPYAPRILSSVSVFLKGLPLAGGELTAGLRGWVLGPRPLPDGFLADVTGSADLTTRFDRGPWFVGLDVDDVVGVRWRDGEYVYASWWNTDERRRELPARHLTAGTPPAARLSVGVQL